jgi:hypothetical protein
MLIHELGHAFGLIEPGDGHVGWLSGIPGTGSSNIMYKSSAGSGDSITLGQAFRMSLETFSWLNTPRPSGKTVRGQWASGLAIPAPPVSCPCATYDAPGQCPELGLTVPTPTSTTTAGTPACSASLVGPAVIACNTQGTFTATFYKAGTSGSQLEAPVSWVVDTSVLKVEALPVPPFGSNPSYSATVTGVANGTTDVVVYGGGPSSKATATVQVTGCS